MYAPPVNNPSDGTSHMNGTRLYIRQAKVADAQRIAELSGELGYPVDREQMEQRLQSIVEKADHAVFVGEVESGGVVGWIHAFVTASLVVEPFVELGGLIVASSHRGQGIGKLLVSEAERWGRGKGIATVRVRSRSTRELAHVFYRKLGYRHVKTQETFSRDL
jgi:GNAT superfamily N-acetyltransferase